MNMLNSLIIEGNVKNVKETGANCCEITVEYIRFYENENGETVEEVSTFPVETWGKLAEVCKTKCSEGRGLRIVGRLKQNCWKDADGKNNSRLVVVAEHIDFKPLKRN